ncbi:MAG: glycoside hydrolase family 95 protein [Acidobacteriaceae bacterium]
MDSINLKSPDFSRRSFLRNSLLTGTYLSQRSLWAKSVAAVKPSAETDYVLFFNQPAQEWVQALPVGNGRLGAMVFGTTDREHLQLNDDTVWDGEMRDRNNPAAGTAVPEIRRLLFAGKVKEAEALAASDMISIPRRLPNYETLGDLWLDFGAGHTAQEYRRSLNLDTGIASVRYQANGIEYVREVFSSAPDQVIVVRLQANRKGAISFSALLDRPAAGRTEVISANRMVMTGEAFPPVDGDPATLERHVGIQFRAELQVIVEGGKAEAATDSINVSHADAVTLLIASATGYRDKDMEKACRDALMKAGKSYAELRRRHVADHQAIFRRAEIQLANQPDPLRDVPTDERLQRVMHGGEDQHLLQTYYQLGRYLLIGSSRPGTMAANLQGIWNSSINPPWGSKYTININTEMNYWMAEPANFADLHGPLFDLLDSTRGPGAITAQKYYKSRGFVAHHNTDIWGDAVPIDGVGSGIWPMGAAWLSTHLWTHYEYSGDKKFLAERAYPVFREIAQFFLDYLVESPDGHLVTGPSLSPENQYVLPDGTVASLCMGPTMDIEITRAVFLRLIWSGEILDRDAALREQVKAAMEKLPPFKISSMGTLQEWQEDYKEHEPGHRHISHLWALFPDDQITLRKTPKLAQAARRSLERRLAYGSGSTGWSRAWIVNCWARLEDGDAAYENLLQLLRRSTRSNLFDVCGMKANSPYQIDGNLGAVSGIMEMLLQSHSDVVRFLPALPKAWPTGSFRGLRARGGLEVDLTWSKGKPTSARLKALLDKRHTLAAAPGVKIASVTSGFKKMALAQEPEDMISFAAKRGETYLVRFTTT